MSPQQLHDVYSRFVIPEESLKSNGYLYYDNESSKRAEFKKDKWSAFTFMPDNDNTRKCTRCSRLFNRKSTFSSPNLCQYHPHKIEVVNGFRYHSCCMKRSGTSKGCQSHSFHVHQQPSESILEEFVQTPKPVSTRDFRSNKIFGLDVEMIHTDNGMEAARISLVDFEGRIMIDEFIKPEGKIVHLNTQFSGIEMCHLHEAKTLKQIHRLLFRFINQKSILIGHGLSNDLKVLHLVHMNVIDTGLLFSDGNGKMISLKKLAKTILDEEIQEKRGGHDSVEDATTCLKIMDKLVNIY